MTYEKISIYTDLAQLFWKKGEVDKSILKVACALLECSKELNLPDP